MLIRRADLNDSNEIWNWRNDNVTRSNSLTQKMFSFENHNSWYQNALANPHTYIYIGLIDSCKIGICRFNLVSITTHADVSINLNPEFRGKGLSQELLKGSMESFFSNPTMPHSLIATIRESNLPSIKLFENLNFRFSKSLDGVAEYKYN